MIKFSPTPDQLAIIDAHHHLWDLEHNRYPWLQERPLKPRLEGDIEPIARTYGIEDCLADVRNQNVVKSVHVECGCFSRPRTRTRKPVGSTG